MEQKQAVYGRESLEGFVPGIQPPARRPLKIFAFDPSLRRAAGNLAVVDVVNEDVKPGPEGRLVQVVDYNATDDVYYPPINLDDPDVLIQRGLDPSDSDPRFHQQMVYAVVMKVIENFERALGRPFSFRRQQKLTVLPHAFEGENAFYDPETVSLLFGYFTADLDDPGPNLPGQTVFTCLSHDIVAHETTHAIIDRLRRHFNAPTNRDVLAFHEAIADIVAIFQHFSFPEVLHDQIRATRADLSKPGRLLELARQFGYATGSGKALRSATGLDQATPDPRLYTEVLEPHDRGSILVASVFDAFFRIYRNRTAGLVLAVTGGSGILPEGELQADLVTLATREAANAAQDVLTMCLRAFEYLPPVDVTFGDYLRAIVTADFELNPRDEFERRVSFIDAFRVRGIYAPAVSSLAEEALRLERPRELENASIPADVVTEVLASQFDVVEGGERKRRPSSGYLQLHDFAMANAAALQLDPTLPDNLSLQGFHPSFHLDENGQLLVELVAQWVQTPPEGDPRRLEIGGVVLRAGTTVVFAADGSVRYVAARPLPGPHLTYETHRAVAAQRVEEFQRYAGELDERDALQPWSDENYYATRMSRRAKITAAHLARPSRRSSDA
ncbi:hypothetical protein Rhe02_05420 [Rhizocola hellebori]|uniref:Peptidase M4 n=1 Tax=Rhizocola hellebori TaxID=1392758 RepID=A0A8J3Q2A7_9ACTN|nr:hypothetical protein [Rhizocola hellebori]GIH02475.1 hypothetical protein Rhe02_05420 [Rhizocola hellebori]